jgi:hypothetical protein
MIFSGPDGGMSSYDLPAWREREKAYTAAIRMASDNSALLDLPEALLSASFTGNIANDLGTVFGHFFGSSDPIVGVTAAGVVSDVSQAVNVVARGLHSGSA